LVKRLADISGLIEAVGVGRLDVGAQHHLHRIRTAERGDRQQHRNDPEVNAGEPAEPCILFSAVSLVNVPDLLGNFGRFHLPPPSSSPDHPAMLTSKRRAINSYEGCAT